MIIPASHIYEEDQKNRADTRLDANSMSLSVITSKMISLINSKTQNNRTLINPSGNKTWTVYPGDLLCDHQWHPVDFSDLKVWVQNCEQWMKEGNIVEGNTFQYRWNSNTSDFEVRLGLELDPINNYKGVYRHIFRYTREDTTPKWPVR